MRKFIPLSRPQIDSEEIDEVVDSLRSGWLTTGEKTKLFEKNFSQYIGSNVDSVAVNSATAGLHLALEAIDIKAGDEVITTTHTFTATAEVIRYLGADPVFVDIDELTLCIDASNIINVITPRTKAIIVVHFAGLAANMTRILEIGRKYNIKVIEDAAHALPTSYKGDLIGSLDSDATIFSFYANKTITTGEGGMLVTKNSAIAERARIMRLHGISRDAFDRFTSTTPSWYYEVIAPGFKYNMTDIAASIGLHQILKAEKFRQAREGISEMYFHKLRNFDLILPPKPLLGDNHSWHLFIIQLKNKSVEFRNQAISKMFDQGVGCGVHYIPLHLHPYWKRAYNLNFKSFPISQRVYERSISLPIYPSMSEVDVDRVVLALEHSLSA